MPGGSSITIKLRHRAASLALAATIGLTLFKLVVAQLSGSVGVLSEGVHSFLDLVSASVAFFTVREAGKPADDDHPFGHGKIETVSSLFESLLLVAAAALIIFEGVEHIRRPQVLQHHLLAIVTILISMIVSYLMYRHNLSAAKHTESTALHVNSLHFLSDVIASAGVLVGLILLKWTGWQVIDAIMAFGVALYILVISFSQVRKALLELTDKQLPDSEVTAIRDILSVFKSRILDIHDLRTRKSGATRHIDYHLVVCGQMSVNESHTVCDDMENKIMESFPGASINIHVEPCEHEPNQCLSECPRKGKRS